MLARRASEQDFENVTDQIVGGIRDASFELGAGTFFTLLGPSGCGKTTTLRCIARASRRPTTASSPVDDRRLFRRQGRRVNVPVERRAIGMVFPVLRDLAPYDGGRERGVSVDGGQARQGAPRSRRRCAAPLAVVDLDGFQERSATPAVGRPAAARGARPRHRA